MYNDKHQNRACVPIVGMVETKDSPQELGFSLAIKNPFATMAQLVAQIICTDKVAGSIPACGSSKKIV